jgi:hypothetical protein
MQWQENAVEKVDKGVGILFLTNFFGKKRSQVKYIFLDMLIFF